MYLIDRFSQVLRCKYPVSRNVYVRTCVKLAFANKIEAMYERPHVQLCKRKSRNSLNLTFNLNTLYLTSILFTWLKFTFVNVRSQKRVSGNQTLRMCHITLCLAMTARLDLQPKYSILHQLLRYSCYQGLTKGASAIN